jgi:hypothetical protein
VTPLRVSASVNPGTLAAGRYSCAINIVGIGQQQAEISATLEILSATTLLVTPAQLNFRHQTGDVLPAAQTAAVTSTNPTSGVAFTVQTENCPWLTLTPSSGMTPLNLSLGLNARDLEPGTYECAVGIRATANESTLARLNVSAVIQGRLLSVTTTAIPNGTTGTLYSATLTAQGGTPPYAWTVASGVLATGLSMNPAGMITGTPTDAGAVTFTARVSDSSTPPQTATKQFSATINSGLTFVSTSVPNGTMGVSYTTTLRAQGGTAPYAWAVVQGVLPPGLTLDSTAGSITGTPTSAGRSAVTIRVSDNAQPANRSTTQALTFEIGSNLTINSTLPGGSMSTPYNASLLAEGGTAPYSWSVENGTLPAGLALNAVSGAVTGTPTSPGQFAFDIRVRDGATPPNSATRSFTVTINSGFTVLTTSLPAGTRGTPYTAMLSASGGTSPYTWRIASGALPEGLTLASSGEINGTPGTAVTARFTVETTDSSVPSRQATASLTLTINSALTLAPVSPPRGVAGAPYSLAISATGGQLPYSFSVTSGALPSGLALSTETGTITGAPNANGTFPVTVRCSDAAGGLVSVDLVITIIPVVTPTLSLTNSGPPTTPASVAVGLSERAAAPMEGTLSMSFRANAAGVPADYKDPALAFAAGGTTLNFTVPADANTATLPQSGMFQPGTVAGEITIVLTRLMADSTSLLPSPPPSTTVTVPPMPPVIVPDSVRFVNVTPSGFNIELTGYSTTRAVSSLTLTFQASGGSQLDGSQTFSIDVNPTMTQWYKSAESRGVGSTFQMRVPFTLQGDISAIDSVMVTLANSLGVSQPVSGRRAR